MEIISIYVLYCNCIKIYHQEIYIYDFVYNIYYFVYNYIFEHNQSSPDIHYSVYNYTPTYKLKIHHSSTTATFPS